MWLAVTLGFILGLPSLGSSVAFSAATSITTIGFYVSYGTDTHFSLNLCMSHKLRYTYRTPRLLPSQLHQGTVPPWILLFAHFYHRGSLDHVHLHRPHPPSNKPSNFPDAELRHCRSRMRHDVLYWLLAHQRATVVHGAGTSNRKVRMRFFFSLSFNGCW